MLTSDHKSHFHERFGLAMVLQWWEPTPKRQFKSTRQHENSPSSQTLGRNASETTLFGSITHNNGTHVPQTTKHSSIAAAGVTDFHCHPHFEQSMSAIMFLFSDACLWHPLF